MPAILLTGSEGNLGSYLRASVSAAFPRARIIRVARRPADGLPADVHIGDLRDAQFVSGLFKKEDIGYVIHAAAQTYNAIGFKKNAYGLMAHETGMLTTLLDHASSVKKLVYLSSALVYESSEEAPFTEDLTARIPAPRSSYGLSKFYGEKLVEAFHAQHGVPYTIWRPFNIVSPLEPHLQEGGHVFVDFYRKLFVEHQETIEIFGSGDQVRCFTWVEDVADAMARFLADPRTDNQVFNIGSGEQKTLRDLCAAMVEIGVQEGLLPQGYAPQIESGGTFSGVDTQRRVPSLLKIEQALGWNAATSFRDCFTNFIRDKSS
ncbi:MAG TPA: NAD-dependent epimerase/dehydratase family protein [Candidatus Paceibacterota bacterium]|jgi:nucleoside-diphosphate-sugar epimerase|nr:NAD-dependent epimerase/dehydratase family protein [Candidatus Paceibacterota bacterium]